MLNRLSNWKDVVGKVGARLSRWKVKTLSVGGRLALIKSVLGSTPTFFMLLFKAPMDVLQKIEAMNNNFFVGADLEEKKVTWISWKKVLSQKKYNGGLGVSSTFSLNHALLSKCVWWFCSNLDALQARVVKAMHGEKALIECILSAGSTSVWIDILKVVSQLSEKGFALIQFCQKKVGDGAVTSFWEDVWIGDSSLKS